MAPQIVGHQGPRILESKGYGGVIISAPQADLGNPPSPILHLEISSGVKVQGSIRSLSWPEEILVASREC